jgi:RsiW-degrading membrane proteinase PrsW (M82 family)
MFIIPFHEHFASDQFPSERTLFFIGAACVGAGFAVFENFLYFAMVALEKSRDYRIVSWTDFHGICLVRTVQCVHLVWAMISAVFFLAQGEGAEDGRMIWNFRLARVIKAVALSWFLHAVFNITAIFINNATETRPTLLWALAFAIYNFVLLRCISRRYFRQLQPSSSSQ